MRKWAFTCHRCDHVPDKQWIATDMEDDNEWFGEWIWPDPDYVPTMKISKRTGLPAFAALHLPSRCNACKARYRRSTRMKKRIKRIMEICEELPTGYKVPKLLTFALPVSTSDFYSDRTVLIDELNQLLPAARKILKKNHIIGGTFVIECTSRLMPMDDGGSVFQWKHHPHVHMVCIGKYQKDIQEFSKCLMPIGLGRINYEATKSKRKIGNYLSKYLVKDNQRSRTWGVLYKSKLNSFLKTVVKISS